MLLRFFQTLQPLALIALPLLAAAIWVFALFGEPLPVQLEEHPFLLRPIYNWAQNWPVLTHILLAVSLVIQSIYWNSVIDRHRLITRRNYLPALMYLVIASSNTFGMLTLPLVLANFFFIPAVDRMLGFGNSGSAKAAAFDSGLLLALGSCFFPPLMVLLPLLFIGLAYLRAFSIREWLLVLLGIAVPQLFILVWFYWTNNLPQVFEQFGRMGDLHWTNPGTPSISLVVYMLILLWIAFVGWGPYSKSISINVVRVKRSLILLVWMLCMVPLLWLFPGNHLRASGLLLALPLSIYLANYFTFAKNQWLAELLFFLLLISNILHQWEAHLAS